MLRSWSATKPSTGGETRWGCCHCGGGNGNSGTTATSSRGRQSRPRKPSRDDGSQGSGPFDRPDSRTYIPPRARRVFAWPPEHSYVPSSSILAYFTPATGQRRPVGHHYTMLVDRDDS